MTLCNVREWPTVRNPKESITQQTVLVTARQLFLFWCTLTTLIFIVYASDQTPNSTMINSLSTIRVNILCVTWSELSECPRHILFPQCWISTVYLILFYSFEQTTALNKQSFEPFKIICSASPNAQRIHKGLHDINFYELPWTQCSLHMYKLLTA